MKTFFLVIGMVAAGAAYGTDAFPFDAKRMSRDVRILSSDEFEGRAPGTSGEKKTVDYLVEQFKAAGLQPGGDLVAGKRSWTQDVPLRQFNIKGPLTITLNKGKESQQFVQGREMTFRASMTGASVTAFKNAPMVFVGYGVTAPERRWDDFKGIDLKGKLAIVLINDPDFETGDGEFGGKAMTYYGRWTYKFEEMARRGALGTIIIHENAPASYGWATVKNTNEGSMFDIVRKDATKVHAPVESWVQRDVAVAMFQRAGLDFDAAKKQAQTREFTPVELTGLTLSGRYEMDVKTISSKNVIAVREGKKRPNEYVIYSAHWDHIGVGKPDDSGDAIYNGAVDNGTGMAALLELGRAYAAGPAPQRTVLFISTTCEEKDLLGTEYYASNPLYPLAATVGMINVDSLDPQGAARNFTMAGDARSDMTNLLVVKARERDVAYSPDTRPEAGLFFRNDHFPMAKRGVPAVSFKSGNDLIEGGVAAGKAWRDGYTANNYHQPSDHWNEKWSFAGIARDLTILHAAGDELANSSAWPNWAKESEFRAVRDQTAAQRR